MQHQKVKVIFLFITWILKGFAKISVRIFILPLIHASNCQCCNLRIKGLHERIFGCYFMLENKLDIHRNSYTFMFSLQMQPCKLVMYSTKNGFMLHFHYEVLTEFSAKSEHALMLSGWSHSQLSNLCSGIALPKSSEVKQRIYMYFMSP